MSKINTQRIWLPLTIGLIALAVRIKPFIQAGDFFLVPLDFDEGVYYGAGVLISRGLLPYRDFDFGHPPGIAWLLGLWHVLSPLSSSSESFALAKLAIACLGAMTTLGIYKLGCRWQGLTAGVLASLLYASYPEAIVSERSIFLEPLINAAVVLALLAQDSMKRPLLPAGLLLALAVSVKITAVIWILPFFLLAWQNGRIRAIAWLIGAGSLGFAIFVLPWIVPDPAAFWEDVIRFQLSRPPDGDVALFLRLHSIFRDQHLAMNVFMVMGLLAYPSLKGPEKSLWAAMSLALLLAFIILLSSKGFWSQYNTLLALPQALLTIFALKPISHWRSRPWILASAGLFLLALPLRSAFKSGRARAPIQQHFIEELQKLPASACIFSFEPGWLIMADRFPSPCPGRPILDTYLVMLMAADQLQRPYSSVVDAFATPGSQSLILQQIRSSDYLLMDERGSYQLNAQSKLDIQNLFHSQGTILQRK